jgi:3-methyladenine DNA glycosylase AlkD
MNAKKVMAALRVVSETKSISVLQGFFKTGPGQYGEGDIFIGVRVPAARKVAKQFLHLPEEELKKLLNSSIHEERLCALLILVERFKKGDSKDQKIIFTLYMQSAAQINNWDLVDLTAPYIPGPYLFDKDRKQLFKFAKSPLLWERRIAIVSTHYFIRQNDFQDTLDISEILLNDQEDLIHKAVGWMLREVGKRDQDAEETFLKKHYHSMPRTMLRYAIEKFPEEKRQAYLKGLI